MKRIVHMKHVALILGALALPMAVACERKDRQRDANEIGENTGNFGSGERSETDTALDAPQVRDSDSNLAGGQQVDVVVTEDSNFVDNMSDHVGKTVQVTGTVAKVVGQNAFTVDTDGSGGNDEALIINTSAQGMAVDEGTRVTVIGPVQNLETVAKWESDFNADLDDEKFKDYEGKPVVAATRVERIEGDRPIAE